MLENFLFESRHIEHYAHTRGLLDGDHFASKLSSWIAVGCLSVRQVYWATRRYEQKFSPTIHTETFLQHLKVRDFWRYYCLCHGDKVEREYGLLDTPKFTWINNLEIIHRWRIGQTGMPLIDALMRELMTTGYMSNRGRHLCAMYLTLDLR